MIHEIDIKGVVQVAPSEFASARGTFRYDTADPYAVTATFSANDDDEGVEWIFARELLALGLKNNVGTGDVKVAPVPEYGDSISFSLLSDEGTAVLLFPLADISGFVEYTFRMVNWGDEGSKINMDAVLAEILDAG